MSAIIVVGTQWGDEGKGRVVDWLARDARLAARFNGGDNAGHTVVAQGHTLRLHLVPSGVLHPDLICLIGAGVVVNFSAVPWADPRGFSVTSEDYHILESPPAGA